MGLNSEVAEAHDALGAGPSRGIDAEQLRVRLTRNRAAAQVALIQTNGGRRVVVPLVYKGNGRVRPLSAWEVGT